MARLPQIGGDNGQWGEILNDFLLQSHKNDGSLKAGSVTNDSIATNAVSEDKLQNNSVSSDKILINAVTREKIAPQAVTTSLIEDNAITTSKLAPSSITTDKLATLAPPAENQVLAYNGGQLAWQTHYNTSQAAAEELAKNIESLHERGGDLVTNGNGALRNNYNFPSYTINFNDAPDGSIASFYVNTQNQTSPIVTEYIPYNVNKAYRFSVDVRQTVPGATNVAYLYLAPFDSAKRIISPYNYMYIQGTTTTLAQPVKNGDTKIYLTSAENWYGLPEKPTPSGTTYLRRMILWNYTDQNGKTWPAETYSRTVTETNMWDHGAVNIADNSITLNKPWNLGSFDAGHPVSNSTTGATYMYMPSLAQTRVPETWTNYSDLLMPQKQLVNGVAETGQANWNDTLPPGTAYLRLGFLLNYPPSPANPIAGRHAIANVSVMPIDKQTAISSWRGVPAGPGALGIPGQTAFDENYLYICTAPNTWKRLPISSW